MSTIWRMSGIGIFGGGDLELSELRLWGASEALDAGAVLTCSHAPITGTLANLNDADPTTACRWRAADVRSPGFFIQWETPAAVDVWCVRLSSAAKATSVARYDLASQLDGVWASAHNGDLVYTVGLSAARVVRPAYGVGPWWLQPVGPTSGSGGFAGAAVSADGQTILAAGFGSSAAKVSASKDGGATWSQLVGPLAGATGFHGIASSADGQTIAVAGFGSAAARVSISRDGGATWSQPTGPVASASGFVGVAVSEDGKVIAAAGFGSSAAKVSISKDSGATWSQPAGVVAGADGFQGIAVSADGQTIAVAGCGNASSRVNISRDGGATWLQPTGPTAGTYGFVCVAASANGKVIATAGSGDSAAKVSISKDGGVTWKQPDGPTSGSGGYVGIAVSADGRTIAAAGFGSAAAKVSISRDGGTAWLQPVGLAAGSSGFAGAAASADGRVIAAVGNGDSTAKVNVYIGADPTYVAPPLTFGNVSAFVLPSEVPPPTQGLRSVGGSSVMKLLDVEFGGDGRIYGTVARKGAPSNTPMRRRVRLHRSRDGMLIRETWSKPDGAYEFKEISGRYEYDVVAWDHEMSFRSVVANNLTPEAM